MAPTLWTIGHSTRTIEELLALLQAHGIRMVADVRRFPASRRYPHFNQPALQQSLAESGIGYAHLEAVGGRRESRPDSPNLGWRNAAFRGYADYMQTGPFWQGLAQLMDLATGQRTALMCAEAVPWRCHRLLLSDALSSRGWTVRHILTAEKADPHTMTPFAQVQNDRVLYPAGNTSARPSLFP